MSKIDQNSACPCGSGKKYKKCRINDSSIVNLFGNSRETLREIEANTVPIIHTLISEHLGDEIVHDAWYDFLHGEDIPIDSDREGSFGTMFWQWHYFSWCPYALDNDGNPLPSALPEIPLAEYLLNEYPNAFNQDQTQFINTAVNEAFSFYRVLAFIPDKQITLYDILHDRTVIVVEKALTQYVSPGNVVYGRVISFEGTSIFLGTGDVLIPAAYEQQIPSLNEFNRKMQGTESGKTALLTDDITRHFYFALRETIYPVDSPNAFDVEALSSTRRELEFLLHCSVAEAFDLLASLSTKYSKESLLEFGKFNRQGELIEITFDWHEKGNASFGRIHIEAGQVLAEVDSLGHCETLERKLKRRLTKKRAHYMGSIPLV